MPFFLFSALSSFFTITAKNPVHSVLFLILTFLNCSAVLFLFELEFIPLIFVIVYVGAVVILFLFVVMMLNIKISTKSDDFFKYFSIGAFIGFVFLIEILYSLGEAFFFLAGPMGNKSFFSFYTNPEAFSNLKNIGILLYTKYCVFFLLAGIALLVAMFGAIALTLRYQKVEREQNSFKQLSRDTFSSSFYIKNM
jgi:NADH-quinone oxidoreductase subunit J